MKPLRSHRNLVLPIGLLLLAGCLTLSPEELSQGGLPNCPTPTLGGKQFWSDVAWADGWRVQRHVWSRHHRLLDPRDVRHAWGTERYCVSKLPAEREHELVVLLHGLARSRSSLARLEEELEQEGYRVASLSYASTRASIDEHARTVESVLDTHPGLESVSFVTHSLGGRVARRVLERDGAWKDGVEQIRVVQIAPPNQGAQIAGRVREVPFVGLVLGPAFLELTHSDACQEHPGGEFGVIAGKNGKSRAGWNPWISGNDDGLVGCTETRPGFEHDYLEVNTIHTFLMNHERTLEATKQFLASGRFAE